MPSTADPRHSCFRKKRYPTEALADKVRRHVAHERGTPLRVYFCDACGGFHLTHVDAG